MDPNLAHQNSQFLSQLFEKTGLTAGQEGVVADVPSKEEISLRIEVSEQRTEAKIARLEGKIDRLLEKADAAIDSTRSTRNNIWGMGVALGALIVAVAALFPAFYDLGAKHREAISSEVKDQVSRQRAPEASPPQPSSTSRPK